MADLTIDFRRVPVLDENLQKYYDDALSYSGHIERDKARNARRWFWLAMFALFALAVSITTNLIMLPLKETVPFPVVAHDDGTVDTGISLADLGPTMVEKIITGSVWRYVEERESYSYSDAKKRYDFVSLMSAENVQRDYQSWFLNSKDSPNKALNKEHLTISVKEISQVPVRDGVIAVRFWKTAQFSGEREARASMTATVEYEKLPSIPKYLFLGGDHAGIQVTRYRLEQDSAP